MDALDLLISNVTAMREEQRADHSTLVTKVDGIATIIADHSREDTERFAALDKRLSPIETTRRVMHWTIGAMFSALLYGVFDFLVNHARK